jgi:hypothetical protein
MRQETGITMVDLTGCGKPLCAVHSEFGKKDAQAIPGQVTAIQGDTLVVMETLEYWGYNNPPCGYKKVLEYPTDEAFYLFCTACCKQKGIIW